MLNSAVFNFAWKNQIRRFSYHKLDIHGEPAHLYSLYQCYYHTLLLRTPSLPISVLFDTAMRFKNCSSHADNLPGSNPAGTQERFALRLMLLVAGNPASQFRPTFIPTNHA